MPRSDSFALLTIPFDRQWFTSRLWRRSRFESFLRCRFADLVPADWSLERMRSYLVRDFSVRSEVYVLPSESVATLVTPRSTPSQSSGTLGGGSSISTVANR